MAFGDKTNERPGTRAVLRHARVTPNKVREVLDLVRNLPVAEAEDVLRFSERDAATIVGKVLHSAVANAENNDEQDPEELYVSACFADEGTTIKRWRPRARGRATRIRKRTSHITVIVSRMPQEELARLQAHTRAERRRGVPIEEPETHEHEAEASTTEATAAPEAAVEAPSEAPGEAPSAA